MSNKLMIFGSNRKNGGIPPFDGKRSRLNRIRSYDTGKEEGGSGTLLLNSDENNVIAENVLNYF